MAWDRDRWTEENTRDDWTREADRPTPEKEAYALKLVRTTLDSLGGAALVTTDGVIARSYRDRETPNRPHLAHAHWLFDFLAEQPGIRVESYGREIGRVAIDPEYEEGEARD